MTFAFNPNASAVPGLPWNITFLAQRDVTANVPIDFVTRPGVALTSACFAHDLFEENAAAQCISNLLAASFGRFIVDIYWDVPRQLWTFCPVEVPGPAVTGAIVLSSSTSTASVNATSTSVQSTQLLKRDGTRTTTSASSDATLAAFVTNAVAQQSTTNPLVNATTLTISESTSANATFVVIPTTPANAEEVLYSNGPYTCSQNINLSVLMSVLASFLRATDNTLQAYLYYFTFNLHLAAPYSDPTAIPSPPASSDLPNPDELLSNIFSANLSGYLYTPSLLYQQRSNLNNSWLNGARGQQADPFYFNTEPIDDGDISTPDGWPSQTWLEADKQKRLLLSTGTIDTAMQGYNVSGDSGTIFQNTTFERTDLISYGSNGGLTVGCYFQPDTVSIASDNSSWASSSDLPGLSADILAAPYYNDTILPISNLSYCGISPFLDQTLLNTTADVDISPYVAVVHSSIWSWAFNEPITDVTDPDDDNRCAVLDINTNPPGRWRSWHCSDNKHGACRSRSSPYNWTITNVTSSYTSINQSCPADTFFSVPRTALENAHLLYALQSSPYTNVTNGQEVWIDFNSLDTEACWVIGPDSKCPYDGTSIRNATVTVPVVAGVIILILAALTILIKCGSNRRQSRKSRDRTDGDWEYEGVPS